MILTEYLKPNGFAIGCFAFFVASFAPHSTRAQSEGESDPDWSILMQNPEVKPTEIRAEFEARWEGRERV